MGRITFEVPETKHPFIGLGTGIIITENGKMPPRIVIKFPLHGIEIVTATGEEAKSVISELNNDECFNQDRIEYAKNLACELLGIDSHFIQTRTRNERAVFGRALVWDYCNKRLNMSLAECGRVFSHDHATVHRQLKLLSKDNARFMTGWRDIAYNQFWNKMKDYSF